MVKRVAVLISFVLLMIGILGLVPLIVSIDMDEIIQRSVVFGMFMTGSMVSWVYILCAVAGAVATVSQRWTKRYLQLLTVLFGCLAVIGFGAEVIFQVDARYDIQNVVHLSIAIVSGYFGYVYKRRLNNSL